MDDPLESLRQLAQDIKSQPNITLSHKQIQDYFEKLVVVAHTPDGYESLCWEIGVWLLLLAGERQAILFNAYGYPAIRAALTSAIESGGLPKGLGWYTSGFTPGDVDGDVMLGVLTHPTIQPVLKRTLAAHELCLDLDYLRPSDQQTGSAAVCLLAHLRRVGLDRQTQLMWAARLVEHLDAENPAREQAIRLVLEGLLQAERYVNAFYWLQAYFHAADQNLSDTVFEVTAEIIKIADGMGESGYSVLNSLSYDNDLLGLLYNSKRAQLLLALALLWISFTKGFPVKQDFIDQSAELLWGEYPNITLFVKRVSNWACQLVRQARPAAAVDYLHAPEQRPQALAALKRDLQRPPNLRGRGSALDVWKECRDTVFDPLLSALAQVASHKELRGIKKDIDELGAEALVKNSAAYKSSVRLRKIEAGLHKTLEAHLQKYIDSLAHSADLCYQSLEVTMLVKQLEAEIKWTDLQQEYDELVEHWPSLAECLQSYFSPVLDEWLAGVERVENTPWP